MPPQNDPILQAAGLGGQAPGSTASDPILAAAGLSAKSSGTPPVQSWVSSAPPNETTWFGDAIHHLTGGITDKVDALKRTAFPTADTSVAPGAIPDFGERYRRNLGNIRADYGNYADANPQSDWWARAAGLLPAVVGAAPERVALKVGTTVAERAPSVLRSMFSGAKTGATYGGAYGFGSTDDSSVKQDLIATGTGMATGAAMGGALPAAGAAIKVPGRLAAEVRRPLTAEGPDQIAGRVLNEAAGSAPTNIGHPPLGGMRPTFGQATNNPGLLWLERSVQQGSPRGTELAATSKAANNQAVTRAISRIGNTGSDANQAMSDALDAANRTGRAKYQAAWKAANPSAATGIPTAPLKDAIGTWYGGLTKADRASVPGNLFEPLSKFEDQESLEEIQSLRARVDGETRKAYRAGDTNTARIMGGASKAIDDFLEHVPDAGSGSSLNAEPSVMASYNAARAATKDYKQTFNQPAPVRNVLGMDRYGADKVPVSATANQFLQPSTRKGAPEALNAYLKAITNTKGILDPAGAQAARDAFTQKFLGSVQTTALDQGGMPIVSRAKVTNFLGQYDHVVNSRLFTPEQRGVMRSIQDAADMAERTAQAKPPGGSDTFPKLAGAKFLDVLIGPHAGKLTTAAGTAAGLLAGHAAGPMEMTLGAMGGGFGAHELIGKLYAAPRDKVVSLVTEAMHDPVLAKTLMMKASAANSKLIRPTVRNKMLGILGAQAAGPAAQLATQ